MADLLFSLYLLLVFPLRALLRRPRPDAPALPPLQEYWRQARHALPLLCVMMAVAWHQGHSARALGLDIPLTTPGAWGLAFACALLLSVHCIGLLTERRKAPELRQQQRDKQYAQLREKLRDMPFVLPRTPLETAAYVLTMVGMTSIWELLFRGYLLLVLTPILGMPLAVVLAALAYGATHGYSNPRQFAGSIVAALVFTIGYALTGSLWWLMVLHGAAPVSVLYAARAARRDGPTATPTQKPSAGW